MNYDGASENGKVIVFAQSAMCWIQAYDLYKTYMLMVDSTLPSDYDRNRSDCVARDKLRMMARNLYKSNIV